MRGFNVSLNTRFNAFNKTTTKKPITVATKAGILIANKTKTNHQTNKQTNQQWTNRTFSLDTIHKTLSVNSDGKYA